MSSGTLESEAGIASSFPARRFILDSQRRALYAVGWTNEAPAAKRWAGFRIGEDGTLTPLAEPVFSHEFMRNGVLHPTAPLLFAHDGVDHVATYRLEPATGRATLVSGSVLRLPRRDTFDLRGNASSMGDMVVDPLGEYVFAVRSLWTDICSAGGKCLTAWVERPEYWTLRINSATGALTPGRLTETAALIEIGDATKRPGRWVDPHLAFHPSGHYFYTLTDDGGPDIWAIGIDPVTGALTNPPAPAASLSGLWSTFVLVAS